MGKLSARNKRVKRSVKIGDVASGVSAQVEALDGRIEAIQLLIPLGMEAVIEELQQAVVELTGPRYQRKRSDQPLRRACRLIARRRTTAAPAACGGDRRRNQIRYLLGCLECDRTDRLGG